MDIRDEDIAARLKRLRSERGLTQAELAATAGVSQSAIGNIESGVRTYGSSIVTIAAALGVSPPYLGCLTDARTPDGEVALVRDVPPTMRRSLAVLDAAVQLADRDTRDQIQKVFGLYLSNPKRYGRLLQDVEDLLADGADAARRGELRELPEISQEDLAWARAFALKRHASQVYGAPPFPVRPYSFHLEAVASIAQPYGPFVELLAWLHDVKEDGHATPREIVERFGTLVGEGVELLSDLPGASRKERKAATYLRLGTVIGPLEAALVAKTADRLANVRQCVADGNTRLLEMYRGEHAVFRGAAHRDGLCDALWDELDRLLAASET